MGEGRGAWREPKRRRVFSANAYGATGDGVKNATRAIQKAIDACAKAGGGSVVFKPGSYLTGALFLKTSPDGKLFAGDGGGPNSIAAPDNGRWIYLFRPEMVPDRTNNQLPNSKDLIQPGFFKAEKLVNLSKHDYSLEPNVTFTPDMKWLVFRSNMLGPTHVFAVEIQKSENITRQGQ